MAIRTKTKRRVLILLLGILVFFGAGAGVYAVRMSQIEATNRERLEAGREALKQGDYFNALHKLGSYINRADTPSVKTLYQYARARQQVPEPNGAHVRQAIEHLRRVVDRRPEHTEAQRDLLELYTKAGFNTEAVEKADDLLNDNPDDAPAVRAKMIALMRMRQHKQALQLADRYTRKLKPLDMEGYQLLFRILDQLDRADQAILKRARRALNENKKSPRAQWIMAYAQAVTQNSEAARKWVKKAASHDKLDPRVATRVVGLLDQLGLFDRSLALLRRLEPGTGSDEERQLRRQFARRLWEQGERQQLMERFGGFDPQSTKEDSEVMALVALRHSRDDQRGKAKTIVEALKQRKTDNTAQAWATAFEAVLLKDDLEPAERVAAWEDALQRLPGHPYFRFFLGQARLANENPDGAQKAWQRAAAAAPAWPRPLIAASRLFLNYGREQEALRVIRQAFQRQDGANTPGAWITLAEAWAANLERGDTEAAQQLQQIVDRLQQALPGEPRTLAIQARLLAEAGETKEARQAIKRVLDSDTVLGAESYMNLARVSDEYDLGLRGACLDRLESAHGRTPGLLMARASEHAEKGQPGKGLTLLRQARNAATQPRLKKAYGQAEARYLERIGRPKQARAQWRALAERFPDDLELHRAMVDTNVLWQDKAFARKVIRQLKALTGEDNRDWRAARARWLIQFGDNDQALRDAADLLRPLTDGLRDSAAIRRMLARCYRRLGNPQAAADQLEAARGLADDPAGLELRLAEFRLEQGETSSALSALQSAVQKSSLSRSQRRQAARLFARLDRVPRAIELLEKSYEDTPVPSDLLLAQLYLSEGQLERVGKICEKLLANPSPARIRFVASFYAQRGERDKARAALSRLSEIDATPAVRALIRGRFERRFGDPDKAIEFFTTATEKDPENARAHRRLVITLLELGRFDNAGEAVKTAVKHVSNDPMLTHLREHWSLTSVARSSPLAAQLVVAMARSSNQRGPATKALQHLSEADSLDSPSDALLGSLRSLADDNPQFYPLQMLMVRLYRVAGQPGDAATVAERTMQLFPDRPGAAGMAAQTYAAAGEWRKARQASRQWRERLRDRPKVSADMMLAQAQMQLGQPEAAANRLKPYIDRAFGNPSANAPLIMRHVQAQIAAGRVQRAADRLRPLLAESAPWRGRWIQLAVVSMPDAETAADWLAEVEVHIPEDALNERSQLAQAWHRVGQRFGKSQYREKAIGRLETLAGRKNTPATVHRMLGVFYQGRDQIDKAARHYGKAIEINPNDAIAANNLAMIYVMQDTKLQRAKSLANQALDQNSRAAEFHDTLARVHAKLGDWPLAIKQQKQAVQLQPEDPRWRVPLAKYYTQAEQYDQAQATLDRLNQRLEEGSLPDAMEQTLAKVRETVRQQQ